MESLERFPKVSVWESLGAFGRILNRLAEFWSNWEFWIVWQSFGAFGRVLKRLGDFQSVWEIFGAFVRVLECLGEFQRVWKIFRAFWSVGAFGRVEDRLRMLWRI